MAILAVTLTVAIALIGLSRPQSNAATSPRSSRPAPTTHPTGSAVAAAAQGLPRSAPVQITVPAMKLVTGLRPLGLSADKRAMQLPTTDEAGWYTAGSTPGQPGPTIVVGYIADGHGPGVFAHLAELRTGEQILLRRTDGKVVVYQVDTIASYPRGHFPSAEVYAVSSMPTLRVITTGGSLHRGDPPGNVVVFAHQIAVR